LASETAVQPWCQFKNQIIDQIELAAQQGETAISIPATQHSSVEKEIFFRGSD
jgi:hypothetical protein